MANKIDLTPSLQRPLDPSQLGRDVAALNNLVGVLNDPRITGAEVPPGEDVRARPATIANPEPAPALADPAPALASRNIDKVFYTGRLCVGKDHVAGLTGATIFGFADPIYYLLKHFTGLDVNAVSGKDVPGVRATMQQIGQWGRGTVNEQYPITPARITFTRMVQSLAGSIDAGNPQHVDWRRFGQTDTIWLDSLIMRVETFCKENPGIRVAVTNVRFANEYKFLLAKGWSHYHVLCSVATWTRRLAKQNLTPESPACKDYSEQLAHAMDADVTRRLSKKPVGPGLRVIWNDPDAKLPSSRLLSVPQFIQETSVKSIEKYE